MEIPRFTKNIRKLQSKVTDTLTSDGHDGGWVVDGKDATRSLKNMIQQREKCGETKTHEREKKEGH